MKPISLCLSGGGFRATLFHLGVIRALREFNLLTSIRHIFSVSGGSILAAHLVLNWERYASHNEDAFRTAAKELIDFVRSDLRGRLVRRWAVLGWLPRYHRVRQLVSAYDRLYSRALLEQIRATGRPKLHILATSLISGDACAFLSEGLLRNCTTEMERLFVLPGLPVSVAVAASSAFPPLFPPVVLNRTLMGAEGPEMLIGEILSDGGVFDNLGIDTAKVLLAAEDTRLVVSDASAPFRAETTNRYGVITARTMRTSDILMYRVGCLEAEALLVSNPDTVVACIHQIVKVSDLPEIVGQRAFPIQDESIQEWVRSVRTDLDAFSNVEIRTIYRHGFEVAAAQLNALRPDHMSLLEEPLDWDPSRETTVLQDLSGRFRKYTDKLCEIAARPMGIYSTDARKLDHDGIAALKRARKHRLGLWNSQDRFCWIMLVAIIVAIAASLSWLL